MTPTEQIEALRAALSDYEQGWNDAMKATKVRVEALQSEIDALRLSATPSDAGRTDYEEKAYPLVESLNGALCQVMPDLTDRPRERQQFLNAIHPIIAAALRESGRGEVEQIVKWLRKWKDANMDRLGRDARWELDDVADAIERGDYLQAPLPVEE